MKRFPKAGIFLYNFKKQILFKALQKIIYKLLFIYIFVILKASIKCLLFSIYFIFV
jgi:hypothetical protein